MSGSESSSLSLSSELGLCSLELNLLYMSEN